MPLPQGGRPLRGANAGWWSLHFAFHHTARSVTATTSRRVFTTASQRCVSGQRPVHADAATFPHCFIRHTPSALYSRMAAAITATIITMAPTMNQFLPILRVLAPRYSCCCRSCAALCAVHRVSFSCWVSSGSAMVFPCAIRAVVVCGLLQSETFPRAHRPWCKTLLGEYSIH